MNWEDYLFPSGTFKVNFIGTDKTIRNSQFGAVRVKDAIVDRFRSQFNQRPSVAKDRPDLLINARLAKGELHISLDLSGDSLHRRGYRSHQGEAPLKENLAAALLYRCQWPDIAAQGGTLIDPLCGAGTLLIEGAMMAADIAPGIARDTFGFTRWRNFQPDVWATLRTEAKQRCDSGTDRLRRLIEQGMAFFGYDQHPGALRAAEDNIEAAGLQEFIRVYRKSVASLKCPTHRRINLGLIDDRGYVQIVGRGKDLIISGGYNIYPKEVELALDEQPGVLASTVGEVALSCSLVDKIDCLLFDGIVLIILIPQRVWI